MSQDRFLSVDRGLRRRFPHSIHLEDYSMLELVCIAEQVAETTFGMRFSEGLGTLLENHIAKEYGNIVHQHNAGLAVNLVEDAVGRLAARVVRCRLDVTVATLLLPVLLTYNEEGNCVLQGHFQYDKPTRADTQELKSHQKKASKLVGVRKAGK